ncbi:MAG: Ig-like domain-containing protein [Acidobacteriota bacterium]
MSRPPLKSSLGRFQLWALGCVVVLLLPHVAWAQSSLAEREIAVQEHYALYVEMINETHAGPFDIQVMDYSTVPRSKWEGLTLPEVLTLDLNRRLRLQLQPNTGGAEVKIDFHPEAQALTDEDRAAIPQRWEAYAGNFEQMVQEFGQMSSAPGNPLIPVAVDPYRISGFWDDEPLAYRAFVIWYREKRSGKLSYFLVDEMLDGVDELNYLLVAKETPEALIQAPAPFPNPSPGASEGTGPDSNSGETSAQVCRPSSEELSFSELDPAKVVTNGTLNSGDGVLTFKDTQHHFTWNPRWGHGIEATFGVRCSCQEDCTSAGAIVDIRPDIFERGPWELLTCHSMSRVAEWDSEPRIATDGSTAWASAAMGFWIKGCDLLPLCRCAGANIGMSLTLSPQFAGTKILEADFSLETNDVEATTFKAYVNYQCPACVKIFKVKGRVTGLGVGDAVNLQLSYSQGEESGEQTQAVTSIGDPAGALFQFADRIPDESTVDLVALDPATGAPSPNCLPRQGVVEGQDLVLDVTCSDDDSGLSVPVPATLRIHSVSGPGFDGQALGPVEVRMHAYPQGGGGSTFSVVALERPSVEAGQSETFNLTFPTAVPIGWRVDFDFNAPQNLACYPNQPSPEVSAGMAPVQLTCRSEDRPNVCEFMDCDSDLREWFDDCDETWLQNDEGYWTDTETQIPSYYEVWTLSITCSDEVGTEGLNTGGGGAFGSQNRSVSSGGQTSNYSGPTLRLSVPMGSGSTIPELAAGTRLTVSGQVTDDQGFENLGFQINEVTVEALSLTTDGQTFVAELPTTGLSVGRHTVSAFAVDQHPTHPVPAYVEVPFDVVDGDCSADTQGPALDATPQNGETVPTGENILRAAVSDPNGVERVRFFVNGAPVGHDWSAPYTATWQATAGTHTILTRAFDNCGNRTQRSHVVQVCDGGALPTVDLLTPANGSVLTVGETVTLQANASDDHGVERVQFLKDGGVPIGTDMTPPYAMAWTVEAGVSTLKARVYDGCGQFTADEHTVHVGAGCDAVVDAVAFTSPVAGANLTAGESVTIRANASDTQGIAEVQFYAAGVLVGVDSQAPYAVDWTAQEGVDQLEVRAIDDCDNSRSAFRSVSVAPGCDAAVDVIDLTSPAQGASISEGQAVTLTATASDAQGIEKVQFVRGDGTLIGADTTAPYSLTWIAEAGVTTVKARAYDTCGNFRADAHAITVEPTCDSSVDMVNLTSPVHGATLSEGQTVTLTATATDAQGIEKVQFVRGDGTLIGADFTAPYSVTWTAEAGVTTVKARAYDTCGNFLADAHAITVEPTCDGVVDAVTLTSPSHGTALTAGQTVTLTASASDAQGIEKVQFVRGDGSLIGADFTAPYSLTWTAESGVTTLKARAYDHCGNFKADANGIHVP